MINGISWIISTQSTFNLLPKGNKGELNNVMYTSFVIPSSNMASSNIASTSKSSIVVFFLPVC